MTREELEGMRTSELRKIAMTQADRFPGVQRMLARGAVRIASRDSLINTILKDIRPSSRHS
jgi:hypothetical protein